MIISVGRVLLGSGSFYVDSGFFLDSLLLFGLAETVLSCMFG